MTKDRVSNHDTGRRQPSQQQWCSLLQTILNLRLNNCPCSCVSRLAKVWPIRKIHTGRKGRWTRFSYLAILSFLFWVLLRLSGQHTRHTAKFLKFWMPHLASLTANTKRSSILGFCLKKTISFSSFSRDHQILLPNPWILHRRLDFSPLRYTSN